MLAIGGGVSAAALVETSDVGKGIGSTTSFLAPTKGATAITVIRIGNANEQAFSNASLSILGTDQQTLSVTVAGKLGVALGASETRVSVRAQIGAFSSVFLLPHCEQMR
jgi:hypothetical protein